MSASRRARPGGGAAFLAPPRATFRRIDVLLLTGIFLVALGLRLFYVQQMRASPLFDHPVMDEQYHDEWAQAFAEGQTYIEGPYFRAPLYPWFLGTIYWLFGHDLFAARVVQALLGSLSCGLLFLIGRRIFGRTVGAIAGFTAASYWILIYFDGELLIPLLIVFLDLLLMWMLLEAGEKPRWWRFALAGAVVGLSALARPNILLFVPAIVTWLIWQHRSDWRSAIVRSLCLVAGCLLPIAPVTVRNYAVGGDLVLISSQGGVNFYIGNNPRSDGRTAIVPGTPGGWWEGYRASIALAEEAAGKSVRPSDVSRYYFREALSWIFSNPGDFVAHTWLKTRLFFSSWEISNNKGIYFWTERFGRVLLWLPLGFPVVAPLGLAGLVLCLRRGSSAFPLWGFVIVYSISVILFFCTARYRVPVLPPLILLASYFVVEVARYLKARKWELPLAGAMVLVLSALLVNTWPQGREKFRNDAFSYVRLGGIYARQGDLDRAVESYQSAIAEAPTMLMAHFQLATVLHRQGKLDEAIAEYRTALNCKPTLSSETARMVAEAHYYLAKALASKGRADEAERHVELARHFDPSVVK
ncbi:MAG: glycosyltransferase family 39 protein [Phycisphaerae bacterium]|nr:glycosyltransferase family 39 protein [Phycisphaerae bacterium]